MSFNILYIENLPRDQKKIRNAIEENNQMNPQKTPIRLEIISSPDSLTEKLDLIYDLILADIMYDDPVTKKIDVVNRLDEIIEKVKNWSKNKRLGRSIPIIIYTGTGKNALIKCLEKKDDLYDIWDKNTADQYYVAWRLSLVAIELSRIRPDALLQRLIHQMPNGVSWHKSVIKMAVRYDRGISEQDKISGAGQGIQDILNRLNIWEICKPFWESVCEWEALGKAVSRRTRGHARHVINVFWMGYYLIHHPLLTEYFVNSWRKILKEHKARLKKLKIIRNHNKMQPLELLTIAWFFTAIFHDMSNCVEKFSQVTEFTTKLMDKFLHIVDKSNRKKTNYIPGDLSDKVNMLWNLLGTELTEIIKPQWEQSLVANRPDHGVLAALELLKVLEKSELSFIADEAARAIATHNIINNLEVQNSKLSWEYELLPCLLIFCDQIQTWDRERDDKKLDIQEEPERAELIHFDVQKQNGDIQISLSINYIAPTYLDNVPLEVYTQVSDKLEYILKDKPKRALNKIGKPWPFNVQIKCYLNGSDLETDMNFE